MKIKIGPLEAQVIKKAGQIWMKSAQRETFPADMCNLTVEKPVRMKSRLKTLITCFRGIFDIQWHFNSSASPHFGRISERLVQS